MRRKTVCTSKAAYRLLCAIPYGTLSAAQMRTLASIAADYDRGYGTSHAENMQFTGSSWPKCRIFSNGGAGQHECDPDLRQLRAQHHHRSLRRVAADELIDPRPLAKFSGNGRRSTRNSFSPCRQVQDRHLPAKQDRRGNHDARHRPYLYPGRDGQMPCE